MLNAHQSLRDATHEWHQRVERLAIFKQLLSPHITESQLCETLEVLHEFYAAFEGAMQQHFPPHGAIPYLPKLPALASDVAMLDGQINKYPAKHPAIAPNDLVEAWGVRYVLEGASLGGKVIARHLKKRLPLTAAGLKFYHESPEVETSWHQLISVLENHLQTPEEIDRASTMACRTFAKLYELAVSATSEALMVDECSGVI